MKHSKSIIKRLLVIIIAFTMSVTIFTATYCYLSYRSILYNSLRLQTDYSLQLLNETIQYDINSALSLMDFCVSNDTISSYLKASNNDQENAKSLANHAWQRLREEYRNNSSCIYFDCILISDLEGHYIQISPSNSIQNFPCAAAIKSQEYFDRLYQADPDTFTIGLVKDPLMPPSSNSMIIPLIRPIHAIYGMETSGWCYLALSPNIFINRLKSYNLPPDSRLYLTLGDKTYLWQDNSLVETSEDLSGFSTSSFVTTKDAHSSWYISQILSREALAKQTHVYFFVILLLAGIALFLGLAAALYLHYFINLPIRRLQKQLSLVALGDFSPAPDIEWNNELGEIGKGINSMSSNIGHLINSRMKDQEKKLELDASSWYSSCCFRKSWRISVRSRRGSTSWRPAPEGTKFP